MLSKAESSTIFWVFGMNQPGIEPRSPKPLENTLLIRTMDRDRLYVLRKEEGWGLATTEDWVVATIQSIEQRYRLITVAKNSNVNE